MAKQLWGLLKTLSNFFMWKSSTHPARIVVASGRHAIVGGVGVLVHVETIEAGREASDLTSDSEDVLGALLF